MFAAVLSWGAQSTSAGPTAPSEPAAARVIVSSGTAGEMVAIEKATSRTAISSYVLAVVRGRFKGEAALRSSVRRRSVRAAGFLER